MVSHQEECGVASQGEALKLIEKEKAAKRLEYERNRERYSIRYKEYYEKNKEELREKRREYYLKNLAVSRAKRVEQYKKNLEVEREKSRVRAKERYHLNLEENRIKSRLYHHNRKVQWNPLGKTSKSTNRYRECLKKVGTLTKGVILEAYRINRDRNDGKLVCYLCNKEILGTSNLEHKTPVSRGGTNSLDNLDIAHWHCNSSKGARTYAEWLGEGLCISSM